MHSRRPDFLMTGCAPSLSGHGCGREPLRNTDAHTHTHTHHVLAGQTECLRHVSVPYSTKSVTMFSTKRVITLPNLPSFTFSHTYIIKMFWMAGTWQQVPEWQTCGRSSYEPKTPCNMSPKCKGQMNACVLESPSSSSGMACSSLGCFCSLPFSQILAGH